MWTSGSSVQAPVEWAQRKDTIFVTVLVEDLKEPRVDLSDDALHFRSHGGPDRREFECTVEFYKPVDSSKARRVLSDRSLQLVIPKKESGPFWARLLKSDKKVHWCKVDFHKWKDEDDLSDDEGMNFDFNDMMGQMGGLETGKQETDDLGDSDNEDLPDLEDGEEGEQTGQGDQKDANQTQAAS